ncbi:origin recognition complex subunit 2 [Diorhabda sublineata]|uniref:origin recognition complex subunit 2 n=1 Tax=Diorhabda sublineata TaxID=1163346 RepID=UPI0024E189F4|nr:origin recognition complex subunit 2 [Diorhabda sublineata]
MTSTPTRRSTRIKKPSLKDSLQSLKIQNSGLPHHVVISDETDEEESVEIYPKDDIKTPTMLHENEVVHGEDIFTFQRRPTKDGLAQKVAEAQSLKTPYHVRKKTKSKIAKRLTEDSDSEFEVSSESETDSDTESEDSTSTDSDDKQSKETSKKHSIKESKLEPTISRSRNYKIKAEEYFEKTSSKKIETSNNTLEKLDTPRLPQYELQKLLQNVNLTDNHTRALQKLNKINESCFKRWLYFLNENFNILLYGLGSKRHILNKFHTFFLKNDPVIVINGYFPSLTTKSILDSILTLLEVEDIPGNPVEACELIINEMEQIPETHLYLIIHNIEGEPLRNGKSQNILARLASTRNIHFIASIDHINAPLIWDDNKLSKFNFIWWDATSFALYSEETSFEQSMMVQQSSTLALSSLRNVFASLTSNSKRIYNIIVKHQLENSKNKYYQGLAFKDLYMICREGFIVSSDLALRAQLTEFVDHKMLKMKRSVDGTEYLLIPITNSLLQKFLDDVQ